MWLRILIAGTAAVFASTSLSAPAGVNVQVSNGKPIPTRAQLKIVLKPSDLVRDMLGWQKADPHCDLRTNPSLPITIPASMMTLYTNVAAVGGKNFVTLGFNNKNCGQTSNSGAVTFPNTRELRDEFAAYAVGVVHKVPALGGISIWNELDGTWDGGYTNEAQQLTNYCLLANAVITAVRKVDPTIPIVIGASVGWNIGNWFTNMFDKYGCAGKADPTIWLDVHPYLSWTTISGRNKTDWELWKEAVANIRAAGITNPLVATEWGAKSAYVWSIAHPTGDYMTNFRTYVLDQDSPWGGSMWFEMLYELKFSNAGLFNKSGTLTTFGTEYVATFVN